jgi:hypothetical protein
MIEQLLFATGVLVGLLMGVMAGQFIDIKLRGKK